MKKSKILSLVILIAFISFTGCSDDSSTGSENTKPKAEFTVSPSLGTVETEFLFDASFSNDEEDEANSLEVRWDFNGDGNFDSDWTTNKEATHSYSLVGTYEVRLEVRDSEEMSASTVKKVLVIEIPENMVLIEGGFFMMGDSKNGDEGGYADELPIHEVSLSPFLIGKSEITNQEYCQFLNSEGNQEEGGAAWIDIGSSGCQIEEINGSFSSLAGKEDYPVVCVTWYGAKAYCEWKGGRLPTEAEWEYAARGGLSKARFPLGETIAHENNADEKACYYSYWEGGAPYYSYDLSLAEGYYQGNSGPVAVGCFAENGYGLYDMAGNVYEWCNDWYDLNYYASSPSENPKGPDSGTKRVLRGGCWYGDARDCRVSNRDLNIPTTSNDGIGFRLVMPVE